MKKNFPTKISSKSSKSAYKSSRQRSRLSSKVVHPITEEDFRIISEMSSDFIFSVLINHDNIKTLEWISKGFYKETGFHFQNLLKPNKWKQFLHADDHSILTDINNSIYSNRGITAEFRIIKKDGIISWYHGAFNPVYDRKLKRVVKFYGSLKNITNTKRVEQELVEIKNKLEISIHEKTAQLQKEIEDLKKEINFTSGVEKKTRESNKIIRESVKNLDKQLHETVYKHLWNIFEESEIPTVSIAKNGLCLNYNKAAEKLFGYTHKELSNVESWINKLLPRESYRSIVRRVTYKVLSDQNKSYHFEAVVKSKSGNDLHVVLQINSFYHEGNSIGIQLCQFTDITDKRLAEKALKSTIEKYKTLFSTFPLGITISDNTGKIIESNKASEEILGLSTAVHNDRSIDSSSWKIIRLDGSEMPSGEYASVRALNEGKLISNLEMGIYKSENNIAWLSVTAAPLPQAAGGGVVVTYGDITSNIIDRKSVV